VRCPVIDYSGRIAFVLLGMRDCKRLRLREDDGRERFAKPLIGCGEVDLRPATVPRLAKPENRRNRMHNKCLTELWGLLRGP